MLSKKIDRALRICAAVQELRPEIEAEMCDDDDIREERYARHYLLELACADVAIVAGVICLSWPVLTLLLWLVYVLKPCSGSS